MTEVLRLACLDAEAPPLFSLWTPERGRTGYEPAVAEALGAELGRRVEWVRVPWVDMIPAVRRGDADAVLCGQGITAERRAQVDFTRPYAIFHEGVLVRRGADIHSPEDLVGRKVAAIENSTNMA
ncbi:MAG TPA: transporter substrate-binding domain-containing protein, partial [Mycobacterium sp.]|nr:transporter substrate-binding domain-containing protein [Mycobacterium sp.]